MGEPSRPEPIWVPGTLLQGEDGEIVPGRHAGYLGSGRAFRLCTPGRREELGDRRHTIWLLERCALDDRLIEAEAIILGDRLVDAELQPNAQRWLAEQALVAVSGLKTDRLVANGALRVFVVAIELEDGQPALSASMTCPSGPGWSFRAPLGNLEAARLAADPGAGGASLRRPASLLDRVLRALSGGVLSEDAVLAALQARELVEPGFGYRGRTDTVAATCEQIARAARPLEELFGQVYARAEEQRPTARAIADLLGSAVPSGTRLAPTTVPHCGSAEPVVEPEIVIPTPGGSEGPSYLVGGEPRTALVLPALCRWFVAPAKPWSPTLSAALEQELTAARDGTRPRPSYWPVVVLLATLVLLGLLAYSRLG